METIGRGGQWPVQEEQAQELLIDKYLDNLEREGVWAGSESLMAISDILNLRIRVYSEGCDPLEFGEAEQEGDEQKQVVRVFYNGEDHYDSICTFVDLTTNDVWFLDTAEEVEDSTGVERLDAEKEGVLRSGSLMEECAERSRADKESVEECFSAPHLKLLDGEPIEVNDEERVAVEGVAAVVPSTRTGECDVLREDSADDVRLPGLVVEADIDAECAGMLDGSDGVETPLEPLEEELLLTARQVRSVLGPVLKYVVSPITDESLLFACAYLLEGGVRDSTRIKKCLEVLQDAASKYVDCNKDLINKRCGR